VQGELAQCRQILLGEEVLERPLYALGWIDLAAAQPFAQSVHGQVHVDELRLAYHAGSVSRTFTPVAYSTKSLMLSRCWMLSVEITLMPAARISSTSW
jgi:hypothetical protein